MPFNLSTGEILVLLLVAVVVFGGRLPEVAKRIGKTIHEFKGGMREELRRLDAEPEAPPPEWTPPPDGDDCVGFGAGDPPPEPEGKAEA